MTKNKEFEKQLEQFGIEQTLITRVNLKDKIKTEHKEATTAVIKTLMDRIDGRLWLYNKLDICGVFTAPFAPGQPDLSDFLSGAQAVGHTFLAEIMAASPEQFYVMLQEAAARTAGKPKAE